jgi:hypothetical protein
MAEVDPCGRLAEVLPTIEPVRYLVTKSCHKGRNSPVAAYAVALCRRGLGWLVMDCARRVIERDDATEKVRYYFYAVMKWPEYVVESYSSDPRCGVYVFFLKWLHVKGVVKVPPCDDGKG